MTKASYIAICLGIIAMFATLLLADMIWSWFKVVWPLFKGAAILEMDIWKIK